MRKRLFVFMLALALFLMGSVPAQAGETTGELSVTTPYIDQTESGYTITASLANIGPYEISEVSFFRIRVLAEDQVVDAVTFEYDENLMGLVLQPGESTWWTFDIESDLVIQDDYVYDIETSSEYMIATEPTLGKGMHVYLNSSKLSAPALVENGTTLLPMRAIFEGLGGEVGWDQATKTVTVLFGVDELIHTVGDSFFTLNGEVVEMPRASKETKGTTYLPIRAISEAIGAEVHYGKTGQVGIVSILTP